MRAPFSTSGVPLYMPSFERQGYIHACPLFCPVLNNPRTPWVVCSFAMAPGTMGGHLTFMPGDLSAPTGPAFNVRVPKFELVQPDFIF